MPAKTAGAIKPIKAFRRLATISFETSRKAGYARHRGVVRAGWYGEDNQGLFAATNNGRPGRGGRSVYACFGGIVPSLDPYDFRSTSGRGALKIDIHPKAKWRVCAGRRR